MVIRSDMFFPRNALLQFSPDLGIGSAVSAQLCPPPKMLTEGPPNGDL